MLLMDLRTLPDGLTPARRCDERRIRVEKELSAGLDMLKIDEKHIGAADEKNCEQMIGAVPVPVGIAGPLRITFGNTSGGELWLPLATTEGALVASVNRGCKALTTGSGVKTESTYHGISRSVAFKCSKGMDVCETLVREHEAEWKDAALATSDHLKLLDYDVDLSDGFLFLTLKGDTDEAMGMNMITIAASAAGSWIEKNVEGLRMVTVAGNVDSDKKPSLRTYERGRGYEVFAEATIRKAVIEEVLKTTPEAMLAVAKAKLETGSVIAGAIGANLHAANIVAALYLATGQDAAHVVEGSLADTSVEAVDGGLRIAVRCPAILVGVRGGGTGLPAQRQCLGLLIKPESKLHPCKQLAESVAAAVLAGEVSLLAAQASHTLAKAHVKLGR